MNKRIVEDVLQSINAGLFISKVLSDFMNGLKPYHNNENVKNISIGISIYLQSKILRSHHFGKTQNSEEVVRRSMDKALKLLQNPEAYRSSNVEAGLGGALRSNGVVISVSGFKDEARCEYLAWLILNTIERRLNECDYSLADDRFKNIDNNGYIKKEKKRLIGLNLK